jgi:hypothetical protein
MTAFIYLDDIRNPEQTDVPWVVVRDTQSAFRMVLDAFYCRSEDIVLSLDHDLGEGAPTGYDLVSQIECAIAISDDFRPNINFIIHSQNPVGASNMRKCIDSINKMLEVASGNRQ